MSGAKVMSCNVMSYESCSVMNCEHSHVSGGQRTTVLIKQMWEPVSEVYFPPSSMSAAAP